MQTITELRTSLIENYEAMKTKKMELKEGKELANTAGKIIATANIQLKYQAMQGEKKQIKFLED
jgi:hypothetical protein